MAESEVTVSDRRRGRRVSGVVVLLAVAGALAVVIGVAFAAWWLRLNALSSEIEPVGTRYFAALLAGDGNAAFDMLCQESRGRTSPEELSHIWENARGEDATFTVLAGTGPSGIWPWGSSAKVGVRITADHLHVSRYISVVEQDGEWRVCPGPKTPIQGREP